MDSAIIILVLCGFFASFYGTNVGGAGLILVPLLIFLGLSPKEAVATAIFGYSGMNLIGLCVFHHAEKIDYRVGVIGSLIVLLGAMIGAQILLVLPSDLLQKLIGGFILFSVALMFVPGGHGLQSKKKSTAMNMAGYILLFPLGIISGFIAGGIAILASFILIFFFGQTFIECAATRKIIFLTRTLGLAAIYIYYGLVVWQYAIPLFLIECAGSYVGAHYALKRGNTWVRWLFVAVVIISGTKLLF